MTIAEKDNKNTIHSYSPLRIANGPILSLYDGKMKKNNTPTAHFFLQWNNTMQIL